MPNPLRTGMVRLSSQPNRSTTSLAAAIRPDHRLMMPRARAPPTEALAGTRPRAAAAGAGRRRVPLNMKASSPGMGPTTRASQPQKAAAVATPTRKAAADPRGVAAVEAAEGAGGGVAPAEQQGAQRGHVLGEGGGHEPGAQGGED